jgi:hypothetical protein
MLNRWLSILLKIYREKMRKERQMTQITVKVKPWDVLEKEFGVDGDGDIKCMFSFTKEMEELLPEDRIIKVDFFKKDDLYRWNTDVNDFWLPDEVLEDLD